MCIFEDMRGESGVTEGQLMAADRVALARDVITYGTTEADIALTTGPSSGLLAAPYAPTLVTTQHDLAAHWPPGTAPSAHPPTVRPDAGDPLPQADYVVITWTVPEQQALVDVLARRSETHRLDPVRQKLGDSVQAVHPIQLRAFLAAGRMASYLPVPRRSPGKSVLVMKSELHEFNRDGIHLPDGSESLPVAELFAQIIDEAKPTLVITTGTAGGTMDQSNLGDVMVTRAARFRCRSEFKDAPFSIRPTRATSTSRPEGWPMRPS